jgi:hypothetical protein
MTLLGWILDLFPFFVSRSGAIYGVCHLGYDGMEDVDRTILMFRIGVGVQ